MGFLCVAFLGIALGSQDTPSIGGDEGVAVWRLRIPMGEEKALETHRGLADRAETLGLDIWSEVKGRPGNASRADVAVPSGSKLELAGWLAGIGVSWTVLIEDVRILIDSQMAEMIAAKEADKSEKGALDVSRYHDLEDIYPWLQSLPQDHPDLATNFVVGQSVLGRDIMGVKISNGPGNGNKPALWMDGGIHAREWITPAVLIWIVHEILENAGADPEIRTMLDSVDLYILPVFNPDGYEYTWNFQRTWRKNRRINSGGCFGIDLNRNWDFEWSGPGSSTNPCSDTYRGTAPFSEPEPKAVAEFIRSHPEINGYIDFHAYSQLWMYPYGYTYDPAPDARVMEAVASSTVSAIQQVHGTRFQYGEISRIIYQSSGSSVDWCYGELGIVHSYAPELRDTGFYGFLLPEDQIIPSGEESFAAVKVIADAVARQAPRRRRVPASGLEQ